MKNHTILFKINYICKYPLVNVFMKIPHTLNHAIFTFIFFSSRVLFQQFYALFLRTDTSNIHAYGGYCKQSCSTTYMEKALLGFGFITMFWQLRVLLIG